MLSYGRQMIFTDYDEITKENILNVITESFAIHQRNVFDINYLYDYIAGNQPILKREKETRPEINEKVVINLAQRIKSFKVGYEFSNPITYVKSGEVKALKNRWLEIVKKLFKKNSAIKDDERITALNEMLSEQNKSSQDVLLADSIKTCGLGYRMIMPNDNQDELSLFKITTLNPTMAYVVHKNDAFREVKLAVTYSVDKRGAIHMMAFTRKNLFEISMNSIEEPNNGLVVKPWVYGEIPIIEYTNEKNILGRSFSCFESVMPILDELNTVNSDRANSISQFVQSLLWFHNCEIDETQKQKLVDGNGMITTRSTGNGADAKITYLTETLNQSEIQSYVDYLKEESQEISGVPLFGISTGGSTGSATSMSNGYSEADTRALTSEQEFTQSERQSIKVMLSIARHKHDVDYSDVGSLMVSSIGVKFSRNKSYNLADKVNSWATMIKNGADPLQATTIAGFATDPQQFTEDSKEMIVKLQEAMATSGNTSTSDKANPDKIMQDHSDNLKQSGIGQVL